MIFVLATPAFASSTMTLEEAKNYLKNYNVSRQNSLGEKYTTQYVFNSEDDLNKAAAYIVEHGLGAFNSALDEAIAEATKNDPQITPSLARTPRIQVFEETVSGDGTHSVSAFTGGLAVFDTLGTVEYSIDFGYQVTVTDGKFTNLTSISFDIPYITAGGSWGDTSFPSYCNDSNCGVTANYVITKTLGIDIEGIGFDIKSETDFEFVSLLTSIA